MTPIDQDEKPIISAVHPEPPICLYRKSEDVQARTLVVSGRNLPHATLQFQDVVNRMTSSHFALEVEWTSDTEIRVDMGRIHHLLWPNAKLSLQVRICGGFNYHPLTDWSSTFILADDEDACNSGVDTSNNAQATPNFLSAVVEVVGNLSEVRSIEILTKLLNTNEDMVRAAAATALGKIHDERVIDPLVFALGDPQYFVRQAAIAALTQVSYSFRERVFKSMIDVINSAI